ncbi:MAG TPA: putative lipoprotein [Myxococcota bacterium]|jgi:hypothetical protein
MKSFDRLRTCALAAAIALAAASFACSFSYSSKSISDSSESSSESSSSSSPGSNQTSYRKDVESYTQAFVVSGGNEGAFFPGISDLAKKRGITDWESNENTWRGIGRGLGRTKIDSVQLGVYETNWTAGDSEKIKLIRKGFDETR